MVSARLRDADDARAWPCSTAAWSGARTCSPPSCSVSSPSASSPCSGPSSATRLAFGNDRYGGLIGGLDYAWPQRRRHRSPTPTASRHHPAHPVHALSDDVRHHHPGPHLGAFAERMKFSAYVLFTLLCGRPWSTTPSPTGSGGRTAGSAKRGALDFAGGTRRPHHRRASRPSLRRHRDGQAQGLAARRHAPHTT